MNLSAIASYVHSQLCSNYNNSCLALSQTTNQEVSHDFLNRVIKKQDFVSVFSSFVWSDIPSGGYLILDDTILQKYTLGLNFTLKLKDTKTGGFILGVNIVMLAWTDGTIVKPIAMRFYLGNGTGKITLALELLEQAKVMGFTPQAVLFDSWYGSQKVMQKVIDYGWVFVTKLKRNRRLNRLPLKKYRLTPYWSSLGLLRGRIGVVVYRRGKAFLTTNDLEADWSVVKKLYGIRALIEELFRVLKQICGWQGCQLRCLKSYWNHLAAGLLGYLFLQAKAVKSKVSMYRLHRSHVCGRVPIEVGDVLGFLTSA
jgi:putative transposase